MRIPLLRAVCVPLLAVVVGAGCDALSYYPEDCADELKCPGNNCPGECVPIPPLGFDGPALLWMGPELQAPECPARAPAKVYEGRAGLESTHECPPCSCTQPACQFPAGVTASNTNSCQGPGFTPFDAPASWSGACTAAPSVIPSNDLRSVTIEPATERPCEPVQQPVPTGDISWTVVAKACRGEAVDTVCGDPGLTCLPSAEPPPPGFRQCIMYLREGEPLCPAEYPERFEFFGDVKDERACTPCECTQTSASTCSAWFSTYQDDACTEGLLSTGIGFGSVSCHPVQLPSATLGSMSATWVTNEPGSCAPSGGESIGEVIATNRTIFCCQPPPGE